MVVLRVVVGDPLRVVEVPTRPIGPIGSVWRIIITDGDLLRGRQQLLAAGAGLQ